MSMYVLQVLTGEEMQIRGCLLDIGVEAHVPQEIRLIRSGGRWQTRTYTLIPSYVFVALDNVTRDYYRIRQVTGIIRFLELNGGAATALTPPEEQFIRAFGDKPAPVSHISIDGDRIIMLDGPLKVYSDAGRNIRFNMHRRQATVFKLDSIGKDILLSFNIDNNIDKSPTSTRG